MGEERTFFNEGGCLVTNTRFTNGGQTYAMANVTSVGSAQASITLAVLLVALGFVCLLAHAWMVALFCIAIGGLLIAFRKTYLVLHTAGAERRALSSTDSKFIARIVEAINQAIIHRG